MTKQHQPNLVGFAKAEECNLLLAQLGLAQDLGPLLADHLLAVLRQQYDDLDMERLEFIQADNCSADGIHSADPTILNIKTLALPIDVEVVVIARQTRYRLRLRVILNAQFVGDRYDVKSDVLIRDQTFLGTL